MGLEGRGGGFITAAWLSAGYLIATNADLDEPLLILPDDEPPLAMLPADLPLAEYDCKIAYLICELARVRMGEFRFRERVALYGRIAATVALVMLALDHNGDGIPDGMDWLLDLGRYVVR